MVPYNCVYGNFRKADFPKFLEGKAEAIDHPGSKEWTLVEPALRGVLMFPAVNGPYMRGFGDDIDVINQDLGVVENFLEVVLWVLYILRDYGVRVDCVVDMYVTNSFTYYFVE